MVGGEAQPVRKKKTVSHLRLEDHVIPLPRREARVVDARGGKDRALAGDDDGTVVVRHRVGRRAIRHIGIVEEAGARGQRGG